MKWTEIAFVPDTKAVDALNESWAWEFEQPVYPFLSSMFGGVFFETHTGAVRWLECGTGLFEDVAISKAAFENLLSGERGETSDARVEEWFLPALVTQLRAAGTKPDAGQCYGLKILPIFSGGTYTVDNAFVCPAGEWFSYTGEIHRQVVDMADGESVRLIVEP